LLPKRNLNKKYLLNGPRNFMLMILSQANSRLNRSQNSEELTNSKKANKIRIRSPISIEWNPFEQKVRRWKEAVLEWCQMKRKAETIPLLSTVNNLYLK
jgi:hypothetical protein